MLFENRHIDPMSLVTGTADLKKMEGILATNPWIDYAQVFIDNKKVLNIHVTQRMPQLRVFQQNGNSYYLDRSGHELPVSDHYTHYELIFLNVPTVKNDSLESVLKSNMLQLAKVIKQDTFWQAQTSAIAVNGVNDFELIPVLGIHKIRLGNTEHLKEKLENLFAFYQNVLNKIGWERYTLLDARFENQVIASPSLPWKAPVDRALTNMNWVKTIVGEAPKEENIAALTMQAPQDSIKKAQ
jgi:cell division protein FtsQ